MPDAPLLDATPDPDPGREPAPEPVLEPAFAYRLPALDVDPAPLAAEALALPAQAWVPHFRLTIHSGDWSGLPLRSLGGDPDRIYPGVGLDADWAATRWLDACPATAALLDAVPFELTSVRFMRLGPGSEIRAHNDPGLRAEDGEVRLHVPILSNEHVSFTLAGASLDLRPGACWYLDFTQVHTAANGGAEPRIHLVIDARADVAGLAALRA